MNLPELLQCEDKSSESPAAEAEDNKPTKQLISQPTRGLDTKQSEKMLRCSHRLHPALSPVLDLYRPVPLQRQQVRPLLLYKLMDRLQHELQEETAPLHSIQAQQPDPQRPQTEGFSLTLDTRGYSPEELSVRRAGRKLRVSGRTEKKQEEHGGSYSYSLQEFRREFHLPEGLDPEAISCHLDPDGKLHIQTSGAPGVEEAEKELSIQRRCEEEPQTDGQQELPGQS